MSAPTAPVVGSQWYSRDRREVGSKAGMSDRDLALAFYADTTGRTVETTKELSKKEAGAVIEALDALTTDSDGDK